MTSRAEQALHLTGGRVTPHRDILFTPPMVARMSPQEQRLLNAFDGHDVEEVQAAIGEGADPRSPVRATP